MKRIKHRDGTVSVRMSRDALDELIEGLNFAYIHWQNLVERKILTGNPGRELDEEIRDAYKARMDELADIAESIQQ